MYAACTGTYTCTVFVHCIFYCSLLFPLRSPDNKLDMTGLLQKALARSQTMNLLSFGLIH